MRRQIGEDGGIILALMIYLWLIWFLCGEILWGIVKKI